MSCVGVRRSRIIVTLFKAGHQQTLPVWFFSEPFRPLDPPITNVVDVAVIAVTMIPIVLAYCLTCSSEEHA